LKATAVARDRAGGHAAEEREAIRASGLLALSVPAAHGGAGAAWSEVLEVVRRIAEVDSALAHVFAFHHLQVATVLLYGESDQHESLLGPTARHRWWWGNALNPLDARARLRADGTSLRLEGAKSFCSGARGSDRLIASALREDGSLAILAIPTGRDGVRVLHDWENMGQRQTDSGTVEFHDVRVEPAELLRTPGPGATPRMTLRACLAQSILCNLYAGIARGALTQAVAFVNAEARPWPAAGVDRASRDPYHLQRFAELHLVTRTAELFTRQAAARFDSAWARGEALTAQERAEVALSVVEAKISGTRASLDVSSRIFEALGARATASRFGFDRFWRNARTHTLHDPVDYKLRELGQFVLEGEWPQPSLYG
jgi:alkylation response protein AidB-like acyl-CoA dehydrogenase